MWVSFRRGRAALWLLWPVLFGCHSPSGEARRLTPTPSPSAPARSSAPSALQLPAEPTPAVDAAPPGLPPLTAENPLVALPVPGFEEAVVSLPLGATEPRPVVLALHGNFDRPDWQCSVWREITKGFPFVLCPRGILRRDVPRSWDRWEWASIERTDREIEAALAAMREKYADYLAPGPVLFTGFSLGAILALGIMERHPQQYGPVVLTEGGENGWTKARVRKIFGELGDAGSSPHAKVLFACGQQGCVGKSRALAKRLERYGLSVRVVLGKGAGHTYDGPVADAILGEWPFLVEGDERFSSRVRPR